tara:strand:+ start:866 stop:1066 length:201 start_codon:yes stop_codon:yes gene_type:complete
MFTALRTAVLLSGILLASPAISSEYKEIDLGKEELLSASNLTRSLPAHIMSGITTKVLIDKHLSFE